MGGIFHSRNSRTEMGGLGYGRSGSDRNPPGRDPPAQDILETGEPYWSDQPGSCRRPVWRIEPKYYGRGYKGIVKSFLWILFPACYAWGLPDIALAFLIFFIKIFFLGLFKFVIIHFFIFCSFFNSIKYFFIIFTEQIYFI